MSSIIGPGAPTFRSPLDLQSAGEAAATTTSSSAAASPSPALYQAFGTSVFASTAIGLRAALNAEDTAIILAEAALAIDEATKNASNQRIANAADGRRAGPGQALSDMGAAGTALAANQASRATEAGKLKTQTSNRDVLVQDAKDIQTEIDGLRNLIAGATEEEKPGYEAGLNDALERLGVKNDAIAEVDLAIKDLNTKINGLDGEIAGNRTALAAAGLALISAFTQIAVQLQSADGARVQDAVVSTDLDRRFDDLADTLKAFRQDELARTETDARTADAAQEAQVSRRVMQAALGLVAGLEAVLDLLRQADQASGVNPREAALSASGQRFQLAL